MSFSSQPFLEVIKDASGGNVKTQQKDYLGSGLYPIVDQGKDLIGGYTDDASRLCKVEPPVIVFGDHTRAVKYIDFPFAMGADGTKILVPKKGDDSRYLYHAIKAIKIEEVGYSRHFKFLKEARIPLPPLEEQKRIAKILDAADALRAKRRESLAQLDALLQSTFLDLFGDPALNTKSLPMVTLGELGNWKSGGTPSRSRPEYFGGHINWFSSGDLESLYLAESSEKITDKALEETSAKPVPKGALMLGMYDTAALKAGISCVDASCNQAVAFSLIDHDYVSSIYVYYAITIGREHFKRLQRGVRQKNLNLSMVKSIAIPFPDRKSHEKFFRIAGAINSEIEKLRLHEDELKALFSSLQNKAFSGEL